jgi:pyruvate/2-oxoglutarate dehydrogenase complex dihydrolipoamide acyltransferase (E2) component
MTDAIDLCDEDASQGGNAAWLLDDGDENEASPYRQQASSVAAEQHTAAEVQTNTELYVLDCGCQGRHAELVRKLHENCGLLQEAGFGQTADSLAMAVSSVSCAYCSSLLSAQDTWKLLGPDVSSKLYTTLASSVKQVALAQQGQVRQQTADTQAAAVAGVCCELWGELAALQSLVLGGDPTPPKTTAAAAAGTPSRRGRSAKQQQAKPPAKPKAKKAAKGSGGSGAWAAGTGYGGSDGMTKAAQAAMSAAAARQAAADSAMIAHLTAITAILQDPLGTSTAAAASDPGAAGPSRKRGRSAACLYSGLPWPLCGVALAGPLAWLLRLLFHNDSLMDVVERQELYSAAMELLR